MTNELQINVRDYLSDDRITEICEEEIRREIRKTFGNEDDLVRLIGNVSHTVLFDAISETIGEDALCVLRDKVSALLADDKSIKYALFRQRDMWGGRDSAAVVMMDEIVKRNKPYVESIVKKAIADFAFDEAKEEIYDVAASAIRDALFGKEE